MTLLHLHCSLSLSSISSLHHPKKALKQPIIVQPNLPARDRVIDFGKHKGRMLGSLPSAYLLWVSKTLRAGDSLRWAELADEVLGDPVYMDRIEWELAERVLSGNNTNTFFHSRSTSTSSSSCSSSVSSLLEISERFGWDNEDNTGWARVDFGLLGTSMGGRIPRIGATATAAADAENKNRIEDDESLVRSESGKREERRERRRRRSWSKRRVEEEEAVEPEVEVMRRKSTSGGLRSGNPFPGRGALLDKIRRRDNEI